MRIRDATKSDVRNDIDADAANGVPSGIKAGSGSIDWGCETCSDIRGKSAFIFFLREHSWPLRIIRRDIEVLVDIALNAGGKGIGIGAHAVPWLIG